MEHAIRGRTTVSKHILAIAGAAFLLVPMAGCTQLDAGKATVLSRSAVTKPADTKPAEKPVIKLASNEYVGNAPYVCSPSGFGRTSTCFARSARR
jgi:hypothetical protein